MLTTNLVSYWKLDGNSNDSVTTNNGTDTDITYGTSYGKINQGALLDGDSSKIYLPNDSFKPTGNFTIGAWVYFTVDSTNKEVFFSGYRYDPTTKWYYIGLRVDSSNKAYAQFYYRTSSTVYSVVATGTTTLTKNTWYYLTAVYNGTTISIYVNAKNENTSAAWDQSPSATRTCTTAIGVNRAQGGSNESDGLWWKGYLDEVGIWDRALTSDEISALYNGGNGLTYPFTNIKSINSLYKRSIKTS